MALASAAQASSITLSGGDDDLVVYVYDRRLFQQEETGYDEGEDDESFQLDLNPFSMSDANKRQWKRWSSVRTDPKISVSEKRAAFLDLHSQHKLTVQNYIRNSFDKCRHFAQLIGNQRESVNLALRNLVYHVTSLNSAFAQVESSSQKHIHNFQLLLKSFDADLIVLKSIPIHPTIVAFEDISASVTRIRRGPPFLADYISPDSLQYLAQNAAKSIAEHQHKIETFRAALLQLTENSNQESDSSASTGTELEIMAAAESLLETTMNPILFREEDVIAKVLVKVEWPERVTALLEGDLSSLSQVDTSIKDYLLQLFHIHKDLKSSFVTRMRAVSLLQSSIARLAGEMNSLSSSLTDLSQIYRPLLTVHRLPIAWGTTMIEVVRRIEYDRIIAKRLKEWLDVFSEVREYEVRKRKSFDNEIAIYLPEGLIRGFLTWAALLRLLVGLEALPPVFEVRVGDVPQVLPPLTRDDLISFNGEISKIKRRIEAIQISERTPSVISSLQKLEVVTSEMFSKLDSVDNFIDKKLAGSAIFSRYAAQLRSRQNSMSEDKKMASSIFSAPGEKIQTSSVGRLTRNRSSTIPSPSQNIPEAPESPSPEASSIVAYQKRIQSLERLLKQKYDSELQDKESPGVESLFRRVEELESQNTALNADVARLQKDNDLLIEEIRGNTSRSRKSSFEVGIQTFAGDETSASVHRNLYLSDALIEKVHELTHDADLLDDSLNTKVAHIITVAQEHSEESSADTMDKLHDLVASWNLFKKSLGIHLESGSNPLFESVNKVLEDVVSQFQRASKVIEERKPTIDASQMFPSPTEEAVSVEVPTLSPSSSSSSTPLAQPSALSRMLKKQFQQPHDASERKRTISGKSFDVSTDEDSVPLSHGLAGRKTSSTFNPGKSPATTALQIFTPFSSSLDLPDFNEATTAVFLQRRDQQGKSGTDQKRRFLPFAN